MSSTSNQQLRLGSFSNERWAKNLDASEWIVRMIITASGDGSPISLHQIRSELQALLRYIIANGSCFFDFTLGASVRLQDWLEAEAETDRMEVYSPESEPRYQLSTFMNGVLNARRDEIWQLLKTATGIDNLPTFLKVSH